MKKLTILLLAVMLSFGMKAQLSMYPTYTIGQVKGINADGEADSLGVDCVLEGIVTDINHEASRSPKWLKFAIQDGNEGITVFKIADTLGYRVSLGEQIRVWGAIEQFGGLIEIVPDSIAIVNSNPGTFPDTQTVSMFNDTYESELVRLNNVELVNPADWTISGFGFSVEVTNDVDTFELRIDNESEPFMSSMPAPMGKFDVVGILSQSDNFPYNEGYELYPRFNSDIIPLDYNAEVVINEFLADNDNVNMDQDGEYDDWVELYNPSSMDISLEDYMLSDDGNDLGKFTFPDTSIAAFGYLIIWCDGDINQTGLHADFALSADGEEIYFTDPSGTVVDSIIFGAQKIDTTYGRLPNGTGNFRFTVPTPAAENEPVLPFYQIADVTGNNSDGEPDSADVQCILEGQVISNSFRAGALELFIHDGPDGIGIFSFSETFGYTPTIGDTVRVTGEIGQFNGLTQLYLDDLELISTGNPEPTPDMVSDLDESTEAELVQLDCWWIADADEWDNAGSGFNVPVANEMQDTLTIRIDNEVDLYSMMPPVDTLLSIIGVGSQFDPSVPRFDGYQLLVRSSDDLIKILPPSGADFTVTTTKLEANFTATGVTSPCGVSVEWDFGDGNTGTGFGEQHTYAEEGDYTVCMTVSNLTGSISVCDTITLEDGVGIAENIKSLNVYPNPTNGAITIELPESTNNLQVMSADGKVLIQSVPRNQKQVQLNLGAFDKGYYIIRIEAGQDIYLARVLTQ